jgi:PTH2 family peptidyl-tRNA hydrolase
MTEKNLAPNGEDEGDIPLGRAPSDPVQYYVAVPGIFGAELALMASRAAIMAHRRFHARPGYSRWYDASQAKVLLRAEPEEIAALARTNDGLAIPSPPDRPQIAVFRPRPKNRAGFVARLKLYTGRIGRSSIDKWPVEDSYATIFINGDLELSAGKFAAQAAHAALALQHQCSRLPNWSDWLLAGMPLALIRLPSQMLEATVAEGKAYGVQDAGRTEVPRGTLTAASAWVDSLERWSREPVAALLAFNTGRPVF